MNKNWEPQHFPKGYDAVFAALSHAVTTKTLDAHVVYSGATVEYMGYDEGKIDWVRDELPNWKLTTVKVDDLKRWLLSRGFRTGFFFPEGTEVVDFLDQSHFCYAPKLAAAVTAWQVVSRDEKLLHGKTPKQALLKWLRENANKYGLTDDEGKPNELGIEEIAKVANWNMVGGAAKTPTVVQFNPPTPKKDSKSKAVDEEPDAESIPF